MVLFVGLMAALQILGGIAIYAVAQSAIHEILAAIMFGMGILAFALGAIIENGNKQREILERIAAHK